MTNYTFKDASGSTQTAGAASVASALYPQIQIVSSDSLNTAGVTAAGEILVRGSVVSSAGPGSVSGVGVFSVNPTGNGSVIAVFQAASIAGTYTEDAAHATTDRGLFTLGFRNDTMSSVTSADGDYSAHITGPVGETIVSNSPINRWWSAQTSVMYGTSVQAIAPQGASVFTYITGVQIANDSGTFSRVKITGGLGSVLAWTVAPGNGGSNINFVNPIRTGENSGVSASINGISSVYVSMQGFTAKI